MIEKLIALLSWPADKLNHFVVSALIALGVAFVAVHFTTWNKAAALALWAVIIVGVVKECYDSRHKDKHTVDLFDALAGMAGGVLVVFAMIVSHL